MGFQEKSYHLRKINEIINFSLFHLSDITVKFPQIFGKKYRNLSSGDAIAVPCFKKPSAAYAFCILAPLVLDSGLKACDLMYSRQYGAGRLPAYF